MIYGHDARKVIADNCDFKAVLSATDVDTQEYFSKLVGTYEKVRRSYSQNYDDHFGAPSGRGEQTSRDEKCVIIKPEEFATLQDELILLYRLPKNFCRVKKQPYHLNPWQDVNFDERV
jgi:type IV secretion system protein VirD4